MVDLLQTNGEISEEYGRGKKKLKNGRRARSLKGKNF